MYDCTVYLLRCVGHELLLDCLHSELLVLREPLVPSDDERVHVGDGAARRQDAVALVETDDLAHLDQDLLDNNAELF